MAALAEDRPRQGLVERILVCVRVGAHGLDERLAREGTVGEVVGAVVCVEYAHLYDASPPEAWLALAFGRRGVDGSQGGRGLRGLVGHSTDANLENLDVSVVLPVDDCGQGRGARTRGRRVVRER